jgi:hypothetical protein
MASDGELTTPLFKGRVVVEDVQEDRFTTTVTFRSLPPVGSSLQEKPK